jgi:cytochrome c oxidase assembly protein subunit 15
MDTELFKFHRFTLATLIAVYILILVGGIVRSTGSGMGCPDWPRCFGYWVPPTSIEQLPTDYKEKYSSLRQKKNEKFVRYLKAFGFDETATKLEADQSVLEEADFNAVKTWIEYLNRLTGVIVGFMIIALVWFSWTLRTAHRGILIMSVATLITVIFQGWFGSIVVSTNLTSWTITAHMFIALLIVFMLVWLWHISRNRRPSTVTIKSADIGLRALMVVAMLLLMIQVYLGTEVRSAIDRVAESLPRSRWINGAGRDFIVHRAFSWTVLAVHVILIAKIRKTVIQNASYLYLIILILGTFLTGVGMAYWDVPAMLQPLHLLFAIMTLGTEMMLFLGLGKTEGTTLQTT